MYREGKLNYAEPGDGKMTQQSGTHTLKPEVATAHLPRLPTQMGRRLEGHTGTVKLQVTPYLATVNCQLSTQALLAVSPCYPPAAVYTYYLWRCLVVR